MNYSGFQLNALAGGRGMIPDVPSPVVYATPPSTINKAIALADKEAQQLDCWAFSSISKRFYTFCSVSKRFYKKK